MRLLLGNGEALTNEAELDDFERCGLDERIIFTRTLRSLSKTSGRRSGDASTTSRMGSTLSAVPAFDVPGDTRNKAHGRRSTSFAVQGMRSTSSPSTGPGTYADKDGGIVCAG
eukprot:1431415-Amphidinium_carterae.1